MASAGGSGSPLVGSSDSPRAHAHVLPPVDALGEPTSHARAVANNVGHGLSGSPSADTFGGLKRLRGGSVAMPTRSYA